ncbi:MAG: 4-(cytidine 5'-diphospho)-2-C-methyl-D-erythritol kinase [Alphaproteobacteria bacterium]|nr:4-(cytidine 5'-diphospho)-2-C-methyl-D-erythritol kinase [Alphaproteobacteria bacterium]
MTTVDGGEVRMAAPAKLNLYLHVVGRRDDGYHELDSLVAFADVHDTVAAAEADDLTLTITGPFGADLRDGAEPTGQQGRPDNLVLEAARLLAAEAGITPRAALRLVKRLPVASGIGGGSADAAASLRALSRLWGLAVPEPELMALARRLGADVPVCLAGKAAFMGGVGEMLEPAPALPAVGLVLANPRIALATPPVFKARTGPFSPPARFTEVSGSAAALADLLRGRGNDLGPPAVGLVPAIGDVLTALAQVSGCRLARMSGSGATCFGLFDDAAAARGAADRLLADGRGWWVAAGTLIGDCTAVQAE